MHLMQNETTFHSPIKIFCDLNNIRLVCPHYIKHYYSPTDEQKQIFLEIMCIQNGVVTVVNINYVIIIVHYAANIKSA